MRYKFIICFIEGYHVYGPRMGRTAPVDLLGTCLRCGKKPGSMPKWAAIALDWFFRS